MWFILSSSPSSSASQRSSHALSFLVRIVLNLICWYPIHHTFGSSFISSMTCLVASVHPISFGSKEKTWWNSSNRAIARLASSGGQSFRQSNPPSFSRVARGAPAFVASIIWSVPVCPRPRCLIFLGGQVNIELLGPHWLQPLGRSPALWPSEWVGQ